MRKNLGGVSLEAINDDDFAVKQLCKIEKLNLK